MSVMPAFEPNLALASATVTSHPYGDWRTTRMGDGFDVRAAYAEHGRDLLGFAVNATGDRGMAEECVQEAFTKAWQARERFDPQQASTRTWLFAITRNVITDHLRARARRPVRIVADAGHDVAVPHAMAQVDDHVTLVWALAQVSDLHRRVVVAVRLEGLSYEQLSERDGVPVATLRTRMFHGLRALRDILDTAQHEGSGNGEREDRS